MLHTMKAHQYFSPSIIAVAFFAFATVMGCSRAAPAGKQFSSDIATLNTACDQGMYLACVSLGTKYLAGNGVAKDATKARYYLDKGCTMGNQFGCDQLKLLN